MQLDGMTAVVTGGGSGIGEASALALAGAGCRVVIAGRRADKLREVAARFSGASPLRFHPVDVADRESVASLFNWVNRELGPVDILVNSAGINIPQRSMAELTPENWDLLLQVNTTGAYNCIRAVLPQMRRQRNGVIINIASVAGKRAGVLGGVAYNASKFAVSALGATLAVEEKDYGIRVTNIFPGEVDTPILDHRPQPLTAEHKALILQPEDVAATVLLVATLPPRAHVPELIIKPTAQAYI